MHIQEGTRQKYPVSQKEYPGVVDPETGSLIPKKMEIDSLKFSLQDGKFRTKNYGGSMIVASVADRIHLHEGPKAFFGDASDTMLALALSQAMAPTVFMDTGLTLESSYIRELIGIVEMVFDIFKNELDGKCERTGDPVRARGRLPIRSLALMIRVRMQITVSRSKAKNLTVENALMSAATYEIVKDRGVDVRSEKTERVREIFGAFGVKDPEHLELIHR